MTRRLMTVFGVGTALGTLLSFFLDPRQGKRRRRRVVDQTAGSIRRFARRTGRAGRGVWARAYGLKQKATHLREEPKEYDDVTLARKVESEIFRDQDVPKGQINVNVENGVVYLRGEAPLPELIDDLVERTKRVQGVQRVESLLHLPGTDAPMHQ